MSRQEINGLLADHGSRIKSFMYIAFGSGADARSLQQIGQLFQAKQVAVKPMVAADQTSLARISTRFEGFQQTTS